MASSTSLLNGPELPMHVVHPYPTTPNPSLSRYSKRPDCLKYAVTTFDPGARDVLTCGGTSRPSSQAFFASNPAPIKTNGFDVFVQLVIAAITTEPFFILALSPSITIFSDKPKPR